MNKKKYLFIKPYVYIKCNEKECIVFNTKNSENAHITNSEKIEIFKRLYAYKNNNYYVTEISKQEYDTISELLLFLENTDSGGIIEIDASENQPIIIPPVIRVSNDMGNYSEKSTEYMSDVKTYIHNLHIFLNAYAGSRSKKYFDSYKQFESIKYSTCKEELDYDLLISRLNELDTPPQKIILSGSNICQYKNLPELCSYLFNKFKETIIVFSCDIFDFIDNQSFFTLISVSNFYVKAIIDTSLINENDIVKVKDLENLSLNFIVTTNKELEFVNSLTEKHKILNYTLSPYFNGENLDFFKLNVFLDKEDLLSKQDIFEIASKEIINKQLF